MMTRTYERKFLEDGVTLNPKYRPDTRNGDRHLDKSDRHLDKSDRHLSSESRHGDRTKKKFIGIDGEGVNTDRVVGYSKIKSGKNKPGKKIPVYEHLYVLLVASSDDEPIINENGLGTVECFDFLLKQAQEHPDSVLTCYGASYDVNKMLKDVPFETVRKMYDSENTGRIVAPVYYEGENGYTYKLSYKPRRSFTITRFKKPLNYVMNIKKNRYGERYTKPEPEIDCSVTLWDVSGFFNRSFVEALGDKKVGYFHELLHVENGHEIIEWPDGLRIDLTRMKEMKNKRRSFTRRQIEEILPYCQDEVKALQRLMERLREILEVADLLPFQSQWYGAGSCANALLQRYHVKEHMYEPFPSIGVRDLASAQLTAYSGGRFEMGKFGLHIGKTWNYDLRSAFPSIMVDLPCLTDGMWRHVRGMASWPYSIIHVRWSLHGSPFYPFFFRNDLGSIYYPDGTENDGLEGWYWKPEVDSALRALEEGKIKGSIKALESWEFKPSSDIKPFAFMRDVYETRRQWESEGNPAHKMMKSVINYIYGKTAQSLGWTLDDMRNIVESPTHHNIGYAGYTTASIRARIFDAIMQAPNQIINIVSDGLYSLVPLDLPTGDGMGQWKVSEGDGIVMVGSGVFWDLTKLDREPNEQERQDEFFESKYLCYDGEWYKTDPHYQGFDRGRLKPTDVINWWKKGFMDTMKVQSTRFVTIASASLDEELLKCWGSWREIEMEISPYPQGKRDSAKLPRENEPAKGLEDTVAGRVYVMESPMSAKFKRAWESDDDDIQYLIDGIDKKVYLGEHLESEL